jgi:hypothetical protein
MPDGSVLTLDRSGMARYSNFARFPAPGAAFLTISYLGPNGAPVTVTTRVEIAAPP